MSDAAPRPYALAFAALGAALAAWLLPAWDAALPGGAIVWQVAAVALALAAAWRVRARVRLLAFLTLALALAWLGGVGLLWLLWPR